MNAPVALSPERPLAGLTVLDLSRVLAGPYATQALGDLGADVWKVERPHHGDETRAWGPPFVGAHSAYFLSVNRNKRSVALDLRHPHDLALVRRAALAADVVVENFLPGELARLGLDLAALRAERPELVTCSITGFGQDGPYASLPGYDAVLQGFTGLMAITGEPGGRPLKVGVALVDVLTGVHALAATLGALVGRFRSGAGAALDVALFEVGVASMVNVAQGALATGAPARRHGNAHPHIVPYQTFDARDGAIVVAVGNDGQWRRLCEALDLPELLADAALAANPGRVAERERVVQALDARLATETRATWFERLARAGVPSGAVREVLEAVQDPALAARGMVTDAALSGGSHVPLLGLPWLAGGARPPLRHPPPALDEHGEAFRARFG